jgi:hypothetical protein
LPRKRKPITIPTTITMANNKGSQTCNFFIRTQILAGDTPKGCKLSNHI